MFAFLIRLRDSMRRVPSCGRERTETVAKGCPEMPSYLVFIGAVYLESTAKGLRLSRGAASPRKRKEYVFALSLSCCGDALLVIRGTLSHFGILTFAVAQCVYISLFGLTVDSLVEQPLLGVLSGLLVLGLSLSLLLLFGWSFNELLKSGKHGMRRRFISLVMPMVLVYFALISIMLLSATLQLEQRFNLSSVLGAIGGLLFYVSDVLIAAGAIWQLQVLLHGRILFMCTYYGAQLLITLSVVTQ